MSAVTVAPHLFCFSCQPEGVLIAILARQPHTATALCGEHGEVPQDTPAGVPCPTCTGRSDSHEHAGRCER